MEIKKIPEFKKQIEAIREQNKKSKEKRGQDQEKELVSNFYRYLEECFYDFGAVEGDVNGINDILREENAIIARREDPYDLLVDLSTKAGLEFDLKDFITHDEKENNDDLYANCVQLKNARDIINCYQEGRGEFGGLVTVIGFREGDKITVQKLKGNIKNYGTLDRESVRCVQGFIDVEDLLFVIVRIPTTRFSTELMSDRERAVAEKYEAQRKSYEEAIINYNKKRKLGQANGLPTPTPPQVINIFRSFYFNKKSGTSQWDSTA